MSLDSSDLQIDPFERLEALLDAEAHLLLCRAEDKRPIESEWEKHPADRARVLAHARGGGSHRTDRRRLTGQRGDPCEGRRPGAARARDRPFPANSYRARDVADDDDDDARVAAEYDMVWDGSGVVSDVDTKRATRIQTVAAVVVAVAAVLGLFLSPAGRRTAGGGERLRLPTPRRRAGRRGCHRGRGPTQCGCQRRSRARRGRADRRRRAPDRGQLRPLGPLGEVRRDLGRGRGQRVDLPAGAPVLEPVPRRT